MFPFLRSNWIFLLAAVVLAGGAAWLHWIAPQPEPPPDPSITLIGPQGEPQAVQMPLLARVPPLDLDAACALVRKQNENLREANRRLQDERPGSSDISSYVRDPVEAACADTTRREYAFYDELSESLDAPTQRSREGVYQLLAARREALRRATEAAEVGATLQSLALEAGARADEVNDPDLFLIGAEALALRAQYCAVDTREAAACRAATHKLRGEHLFDAGRWRGDAKLLRQSTGAYRQALNDTAAKSDEWVTLHARLGDALAQLSERESEERRGLLRAALDEYELAQPFVDPDGRWTVAMFNQNICSIRQPLAALDRDRVGTRRAIDECEKARAHYAEIHDKSSEAAAHYNMARALEKLADWDQDEDAALAAVEHVRQTVRLYSEDKVTLSVAFGRVHLADALTDASAFPARRGDGESQAKSRAMREEARASLDAAEPVLTEAKAAGYLSSLARVRQRLEAAR